MSVPILATIQQGITRYGMPIMISIVNLSSLLSIVIFLQRNRRANSYSIYLVLAAVSSIFAINWALLQTVNALNNPPDPFSQSLILCRLRGYILQVANNLYRTSLILAFIDRYAMSSSSVRIREWATKKVAWRAIAMTALAWLIIPCHLLIWETIEKSKCSAFGTYATVYTIYTMIIIFTPLFLMSLFGFFTLRNLGALSSRIASTNRIVTVASERKKKRDADLLRMVLTKVIVYLVLTYAYPLMFLYTTVTANIIDKSATRVQIETSGSFISNTCLQYMNHGSRLFIYFATSLIFRSYVKKRILVGSSNDKTTTPLGITTQRRTIERKSTHRVFPK